MSSLKNFFKIIFSKPEPRITAVETTSDGFITHREDGFTEQVYWQEVELIATYKVDCFSYDTVWLAFVMEGEEEVQVPEYAENFQSFIETDSSIFSDINPCWFFDVTQEGFAENFTILFRRKASIAYDIAMTE